MIVRRIDSLAKVAIVFAVLWWVISVGGVIFLPYLLEHVSCVDSYALLMRFVLGTAAFVSLRVAVTWWLFTTARRDKASPWVWSLLGLVFGLIAVVLFYCVKIYEAHDKQENPT